MESLPGRRAGSGGTQGPAGEDGQTLRRAKRSRHAALFPARHAPCRSCCAVRAAGDTIDNFGECNDRSVHTIIGRAHVDVPLPETGEHTSTLGQC